MYFRDTYHTRVIRDGCFKGHLLQGAPACRDTCIIVLKGHLSQGFSAIRRATYILMQATLGEDGLSPNARPSVRDKSCNEIKTKPREIATCAKINNFVFQNLSALIK